MATIPFPARFFAIFNSYRGPASLLGNLWRLIKSPAKATQILRGLLQGLMTRHLFRRARKRGLNWLELHTHFHWLLIDHSDPRSLHTPIFLAWPL
ncbi:hypothetical protein PtA15_12A424 [Puccinia triticina]|uniref:Uncharacterized protein n=1 Tax=Puccinia triticina TaxID=208348 RepID=A0ABY7D0L0_9BASI|nr:uncharacterized protein PtA15_12A424 [Puccinia triticina]WAQ90435.1 hypothetical protein PtA15_12A424 [Puccinia triticina]